MGDADAIAATAKQQVLLKLIGIGSDAIKRNRALQGWLERGCIKSTEWATFIAAVISGMMAAPSTLLIGQPHTRNSYSPDLLFGCDSALWLLQLKALKDSFGYGVVAEAVVNAQLEAVARKLPRGATVHMVVLGLHGAGPELARWFTVEGCQVHDADVGLSKSFLGLQMGLMGGQSRGKCVPVVCSARVSYGGQGCRPFLVCHRRPRAWSSRRVCT